MSDVDPTPETPVTIGDRLGWWRGDMDARFITLGTKLDTIITKLDGILTALTSSNGNIDAAPIVSAIEAMRGTGTNNTLAKLYGLWNPGSGMLPYDLLDNNYLKTIELVSLLTKSNNALGAEPHDSLELGTVRGFLSAILFASSQIGILPDGDIGSYLNSSSTLSLNGRRYIVWPDLANIVESANGTELTPDSSWSGYSIYIQTTAPAARLHDVTTPAADIDPLAVNTWIDLGGSDTLAFSVESTYQVKGYLRAPTTGAARTIEATLVGTNNNGTWYVIRWAPDAELSYSVAGGLTFYELDNSSHNYDTYTCVFNGAIYRSDDRASSSELVTAPITIGSVTGVTLYSNSSFSIIFTP